MIGQVMRRAWILVALGISLPACAGEVALNRAELIRSLLPSVVNLSVRKEVPVTTNPVVASQP